MNFKKNKPFVLHNTLSEQRSDKYRRFLINLMLVCAFLLPFIFNGFLNYTHLYYVKNNVKLVVLDIFLDYFIKIGVSATQYICFAILAISLCRFGYKKSRTVVALLFTSVFTTYIIISYCVSCLNAGYVLYDFSDTDSAFSFFYALFSAVLIALRDVILILFCIKKAKSVSTDANVPVKPKNFWHSVFDKSSPFRKMSVYFFSVSLTLDIVINLLRALGEIIIAGMESVSSSGTFIEILIGGLPENYSHYVYLLEPFATVIFENCVGLLIMLTACALLERKRIAVEKAAIK